MQRTQERFLLFMNFLPYSVKHGFNPWQLQMSQVFPIDWNAITLPKQTTTSMKFEPEALTVQLGLPYIPLYSRAPIGKTKSRHWPSDHDSWSDSYYPATSSSFTNVHSFLERSQSEDNLSVGNSSCSYSILSLKRSSSLGKILSTPLAPSNLPTKWLKSCG